MSIGPSHTRSGSSSSLLHGKSSCTILGLSFNQDSSCFSVGLETGFRVYSTDPLREIVRREYEEGGISIVGMLYKTNILGLVGGGRFPRYAPNKVVLFDEKVGKPQAELEFRSEVKRTFLRKDRIIIVLDRKVHIFSLEKFPKHLEAHDTCDNPSGILFKPLKSLLGNLGICSISFDENANVLAFPSLQTGHVCITGIGSAPTIATIIPAHESPLAAIALDIYGRLLATASEKGTLIRIFDIKSGRLLCELRRGADRAEIFGIEFSKDSSKVCVTSDKGTVHIFSLQATTLSNTSTIGGGRGRDSNNTNNSTNAVNIAAEYGPTLSDDTQTNKHSNLFFIKDLLPKYFSSQWSFAQCRVGGEQQRCVATFGRDPSTILVISLDGSFYRYRFDPVRGGECVKEYYVKFIQPGIDHE